MITKNLNILIVDDHKVVRNGLSLMLNQQAQFIPVITEADCGNEAIKLCQSHNYDLVILDINLPDIDGILVTKSILQKKPEIKILALSMHDEEYVVKQMLNAGVKGYVLKNIGIEEFIKAIKTILDGKNYFSNEIAQSLIDQYKGARKKNKDESGSDTILTDREKEILYLISKENKNSEIATKLNISIRTVERHRLNILKKLKVKNTAGLIKYAVFSKMI